MIVLLTTVISSTQILHDMHVCYISENVIWMNKMKEWQRGQENRESLHLAHVVLSSKGEEPSGQGKGAPSFILPIRLSSLYRPDFRAAGSQARVLLPVETYPFPNAGVLQGQSIKRKQGCSVHWRFPRPNPALPPPQQQVHFLHTLTSC